MAEVEISFGIWLPGVAFDGMDFREFYYAMTFYQKTGFLLKHNAEDVEHEQKDYRLQPVGTESKVKVNGLYTSRPRHQIISDDENENLIISYTSDAQTMSPINDSLPQERIR